MYLKTLEISGFKSFADHTVINFHKGVTAIVGPNGCGKSNVLDSIRWALGETSAKALRGGSMQDVIFGGTDFRKPLGMAEVSMTFAECEGQLGTDYNEVRVTRRVFRDGGSEYEINKTPCRMRDINRLFMDTGIGRSAYSIMEQGKIDQILSSKPEERRAVFEEAAGITKFKSQKKEALRKLELTEGNLMRVTDIIKEVRRQIGSLQRQANKARRFKKFHDRLRYLEARISLHRFKQLSGQLGGKEEALAKLESEYRQIEEALESREKLLGQRRTKLTELETSVRELDQQLGSSRNQIERSEQQISFNEQRIREHEDFIEKNGIEVAGSEEKLRVQHEIQQNANSDVEAVEGELRELKEKLSSATEAHEKARTEARDNGKKQDEIRRELNRLDENSADARNRLAALQLQQRSYIERVEKLEEDEARMKGEEAEISRHVEELTKSLADKRSALESAQKTAREAGEKLGQMDDQVDQSREAHREAQSGVTQIEAKLTAVRQMLEAHAGYSEVTRKLLEKFKGKGISGALMDHLRVSEGYERAIEVSLGRASEALIVDSPEVFAAVVNELAELGSAVLADASDFSPRVRELEPITKEVDSQPSTPEDEGATGKIRGFLQKIFFPFKTMEEPVKKTAKPKPAQVRADRPERAMSFVDADPLVHELVRRLLDNYYIVSSLEELEKLRRRLPGASIVTLDGEVFHSEGWQVRGQGRTSGRSVLELANEVSTLEGELDQARQEMLEAAARVEQVQADAKTAEEESLNLTRAAQSLEGELTAVDYELQSFQRQVTEAATRVESVSSERVKLAQQETSDHQEMDELKVKVEEFSNKREELTKALDDAQSGSGDLEQKAEECNQAVGDIRVQVASAEQKQRGLHQQRDAVKARVAELEESIAQRKRETESYGERIEKCREAITEAHNAITKTREDISGIEEKLRTQSEERGQIQSGVIEIEESTRSERKQVADLQQKKSAGQVELERAKMEINSLTERVKRSYQLDLEDTYSVVEVILDYERGGDEESSDSSHTESTKAAAIQADGDETQESEPVEDPNESDEPEAEAEAVAQEGDVAEGEAGASDEDSEEHALTAKDIANAEAEGDSDISNKDVDALLDEIPDPINIDESEDEVSEEVSAELSEGEEEPLEMVVEMLEKQKALQSVPQEVLDYTEPDDVDWDLLEAEAAELRDKVDSMGPVNVEAITEFEELQERLTFLENQEADLTKSRDALHDAIRKINTTTRVMFAEAFEQIGKNFSEMFVELFGGGRAHLALSDESDPLESGIEIVAHPPGKQPQAISLLSGGERTMTAVALLFAIYMVKPSPFCVLDEMDAPLDESNVMRFVGILHRFVGQSQFVVITHNKRTISSADVLYGVTMQEHGVSRLVSVRLTSHDESPLFVDEEKKTAEEAEPATEAS